MNIPTQYYEEEFIHFEEQFQVKCKKLEGNKKQDCSEFILQEFVKYEQKIKKEGQKQTCGTQRLQSHDDTIPLLPEDTLKIPKEIDDCSLEKSCIPNQAMHDIDQVKFIQNNYVQTETHYV